MNVDSISAGNTRFRGTSHSECMPYKLHDDWFIFFFQLPSMQMALCSEAGVERQVHLHDTIWLESFRFESFEYADDVRSCVRC